MKNPKTTSFIGEQFPDVSPRKYVRRQRFLRRLERKYQDKLLRYDVN